MQYLNRRSFIKTVIVGAAGVPACPEFVWPHDRASASRAVDGERFTLCHQVRDGHSFLLPQADRRVDVAIVGGGPSGLMAAFALRDLDFLLLEKEGHPGGNSYRQSWRGIPYSTAAAFFAAPSAEIESVLKDIGLIPRAVNGRDAIMMNGKWASDFWGDGLDRLGLPESVRASFRRFQRDAAKVDTAKLRRRLDRQTFAEFLKPYAPEVAQFWTAFGLSEWGGDVESSSAYIGIRSAQPSYESERTTFPGGLGAASEGISDYLEKKVPGRQLFDATVYHVAHTANGRRVRVSYLRNGTPHTVEARAVIIAAPKFIASRIVAGLPEAQRAAMRSMRYAPYPVINLCFDRVVYDQAYDTWAPNHTFTDFIVADWITNYGKGEPKRSHVVTVYTPLRESMRSILLNDESTIDLADKVVTEMNQLLPGAADSLSEVHIFRRGHPMYISAPRIYTEIQPAAARPFGRITFANTDSIGEGSDFSYATEAGMKAAARARFLLGAKQGKTRQ